MKDDMRSKMRSKIMNTAAFMVSRDRKEFMAGADIALDKFEFYYDKLDNQVAKLTLALIFVIIWLIMAMVGMVL